MKKFTKKLTFAFVLVLACVLALTMMVACNGNGEPQPQEPAHTHNYTKWASDETNHWKVCDGADCTAIDETSIAAHVDSDSNGVCDECGREGLHVHTYVWKSNAEKHWQECSDSACSAKTAEAEHNFGEGNTCEVCDYVRHVHDYKWVNDETNHWKVCKDSDCSAIEEGSTAAHADTDGDELCDTCGYDMHVHAYTQQKYDETYHWMGCPKDSALDEDTKAKHTDADEDGNCDTCGRKITHSVIVKGPDGNPIAGLTVSIDFGDEKTTDADGKVTFDGFAPDEGYISIEGYDNAYLYLTEYTETGKFTYEITLTEEVTNTFKVKTAAGGTVLGGITVKVMSGETVLASGATDAEGLVELTYKWSNNNYTIALENLGENYYFDGKTIRGDNYESVQNINVKEYKTYTVTVELGTGVELTTEGLVVELYESNYWTGAETKAGSGTVNAEGVATIKTTASGMNAINVKIKDLASDYTASATIAAMSTETSVTLTINAAGSSSGGDDTPVSTTLSVGEQTVNAAAGVGTNYTFTAEEAGTYKISTTNGDGWMAYGYDEGMELSVTLTEGQTITINCGSYWGSACSYIVKVEKVEGSGSDTPTANVLTLGEQEVNATMNGTTYTFTATEAGNYKISSTDANFGLTDPNCVFDGVWGANESKVFTLTEGQTISVNFCMYDESASGTYTVKVEKVEGSSTPDPEPDPEQADYTFPEGAQGTWYLEDGTVIIVDEHTVKADGVWGDYYTTETATINSASVTVYKIQIEEFNYGLYTDGTDWYFGEYQRGNLVAEKLHSIIFPEAVRGTWYIEDSNGTEITITIDSFSNGNQTGYKYSIVEESGVTKYSFMLGRANSYVYKNGENWYFVQGPEEYQLLSEAPAAATIPDAIHGDWKDTTNNKSITISETKITGDIEAYSQYNDFSVSEEDGIITIADAYEYWTMVYDSESDTLEYVMKEWDFETSAMVTIEGSFTRSEGGDDTPQYGTLTAGENTVTATADGSRSIFTSENGGTYTVTFGSDVTVQYFEDLSWETATSGQEFTLAEGGTLWLRFAMTGDNTEGTVTITEKVAE